MIVWNSNFKFWSNIQNTKIIRYKLKVHIFDPSSPCWDYDLGFRGSDGESWLRHDIFGTKSMLGVLYVQHKVDVGQKLIIKSWLFVSNRNFVPAWNRKKAFNMFRRSKMRISSSCRGPLLEASSNLTTETYQWSLFENVGLRSWKNKDPCPFSSTLKINWII